MSDLSDLQTALNSFNAAFGGLAHSKVPKAAAADDALSFGGSNATQWETSMQTFNNNHINNTANPHGTGANDLGSYSSIQILNRVALKVPISYLPVSFYGPLDGTTISVTGSGTNTLKIAGPQNVMLMGQQIALPTASFLSTGTFDDTGTTYTGTCYFYVRLYQGVMRYWVAKTQVADSQSMMFIGYYTVSGPNWLPLGSIQPVRRIDMYRLSLQDVGQATPVSNGADPFVTSPLNWT